MSWYITPDEARALRGIPKPALAQEHSETSRAAARRIEGVRGAARQRVWEWFGYAKDGLTDEEGIEVTGLGASTYRPRRVELVEANLIVDSGRTRKTRSGREATVWVRRA